MSASDRLLNAKLDKEWGRWLALEDPPVAETCGWSPASGQHSQAFCPTLEIERQQCVFSDFVTNFTLAGVFSSGRALGLSYQYQHPNPIR